MDRADRCRSVGEIRSYVDVLIERGAAVDLVARCALGDQAAVKRAVAARPERSSEPDASGVLPLHACAGSRLFTGTVEPPDERGATRLRGIAAALLDAGADPDATLRSFGQEVDAAYLALRARHLALFELLLARGADAHSALASAAWDEDTRFAEAALVAGGDPDRGIHDGRPVLNELVRWGQVRPALWLLEKGASPNVPDARGWTALHQAASRGNERLLLACLEHGGDAARTDSEGSTPLDIALDRKRAKLAAHLEPRTPRRQRC